MASFTFTLQGTSPTTVEATDLLAFRGGNFSTAITVGEYQDSTHVANSSLGDDSSGNTPNNVKFISQAGGTSGDSQADWGDGTEDLDQITDAECTLKINFADASSVDVSSWVFYVYDGTTESSGPSNLDVRAAESGDANWTEAEGSGSALSLADSGSASTSHDRYVALSISPTVFSGSYTATMKTSLVYQ